MRYEAVIGLEVHAELQTQTKMFCSCPVVDLTVAKANTAVCPVCCGLPGALPVINQRAVKYAVRVALALDCVINETSIFARKNYFYPDLPKGYQISQYEYPLAEFGHLIIDTAIGEKSVRIRRVHMEEDTGKLTHVNEESSESYSLVDLNRAGVSLLEIVSEPDMNSAEEASAYASALRDLVRSLGVNSGDMEKGVIRFEANVSIRPIGTTELGTRVEIKNLNTFRGMEKAIRYEVERQSHLLDAGLVVAQETLGWNENEEVTYIQRSKEEAHDYRYFPEPDLPPLVIPSEWVEEIKSQLPELPRARFKRFQSAYQLNPDEARLLANDIQISTYFEEAAALDPSIPAKLLSNWVSGTIFAWMNTHEENIQQIRVRPAQLVELLQTLQRAEINQSTAKTILDEMLHSGQSAGEIIAAHGFQLLSNTSELDTLVANVLAQNQKAVADYQSGKETLANWFFGQVMRAAKGQADPKVLQKVLEKHLQALKNTIV